VCDCSSRSRVRLLARSEPSTLVKLLLRLFNAMSVYPETLARQEEYEHEWIKGTHTGLRLRAQLLRTDLVCVRARQTRTRRRNS
jgi:hypothetical protein